jgi:hypothetical protein
VLKCQFRVLRKGPKALAFSWTRCNLYLLPKPCDGLSGSFATEMSNPEYSDISPPIRNRSRLSTREPQPPVSMSTETAARQIATAFEGTVHTGLRNHMYPLNLGSFPGVSQLEIYLTWDREGSAPFWVDFNSDCTSFTTRPVT